MPLKLERKDGSVLDCMTMPLPDGATMLTFQDITDTENVERALRERNEALETADQMKVDFVHHVSYELRSPLTTIIGFAHLLNDPTTGPLVPKQAEYLNYITTSTNSLFALINNILDLASIDAGAMTLELGPVDIRKTIDNAAEGIEDRLARDRIELEIDVDPSIGSFVADGSRVVQVLYNLLANAVGFSPRYFRDHAERQTHRAQCGFCRDRSRSRNSGRRQGQGVRLVRDVFQRIAVPWRRTWLAAGEIIRRAARGRVRVDLIVGRGTTVTATFRSIKPRTATPRNDRHNDILACACERDGDRRPHGRSCVADRPWRRHHVVGRSRRRQDRRGARLDPISRWRRFDRGPKPDLHACPSYDLPAFPLIYADLYRINDALELEEIGLSPLPEGVVALIEWPERAPAVLPADRIDIALSHRPALGSTARAAEITGYGKGAGQVARLEALRQFLLAPVSSRPSAGAWPAMPRRVPTRG